MNKILNKGIYLVCAVSNNNNYFRHLIPMLHRLISTSRTHMCTEAKVVPLDHSMHDTQCEENAGHVKYALR